MFNKKLMRVIALVLVAIFAFSALACDPADLVANDDAASTPKNTPTTINVTTNDTFKLQGNPFDFSKITNPANGTISRNGNEITYTPNNNFVGVDTFKYELHCYWKSYDKHLYSEATVTITVTDCNYPPEAVNDSINIAKNTPSATVIYVLGNDKDPDGNTLTVTGTSNGPSHGTVQNNGTSVSYTPTAGYSGTDTFQYSISDGKDGTATATVTVTIPNNPPDAVDDGASVRKGSSVTINVLGNDTEPDGDSKTIINYSTPSYGTVTKTANQEIIYTPGSSFTTGDSFTYTISDGDANNPKTDTATVTITNGNKNPKADPDSATVHPGQFVNINVLGNDSDADGDTVSFDSIVSTPAHGTVAVNADGSVTYTANDENFSTDSFRYSIKDAFGGTATATVTITPVNAAPIAETDTVSADVKVAKTINVLGNDKDPDNDPISLVNIASGPANGTAVINADGTITYTASKYVSSDTFTYTITDDLGKTAVGTVIITLNNYPPEAYDDSTDTQQGSPVTINVISNDKDPEDDALTVVTTTNGSNGTTQIVDNKVVYTPNSTYSGTDTFTYTISDGHGNTDTATVTVKINGRPIAAPDSALTLVNRPVDIVVLPNDSDPDGDSLTITTNTAPSHGTVAAKGTNGFTYTPSTDYIGPDSFTYTIADGRGGYATTTVTITINAPPKAFDDTAKTMMVTPVTINVISNDKDPENDPLTVTTTTNGKFGTTQIVDNKVKYTPNSGFVGTDTFTYTISDGKTGTATATVTVVVHSPIDAFDDATATMQNIPVTINVLANDVDLDGDIKTIDSLNSLPSHGSATIVNNQIVYTPANGYVGSDTFRYVARDEDNTTDIATVTVTIHRVNLPPVAVNDTTSTYQNVAINIPVTGNDYDPNNDPLTIITAYTPSHGTVQINGLNILYTPATNYIGTDTFSYVISDGFGGTATATVTVNVGTTITYTSGSTPTYVYGGTAGYTSNPNEISDTKSNVVPVTGNVPLNPILLLVFLFAGLAVVLLYLKRRGSDAE